MRGVERRKVGRQERHPQEQRRTHARENIARLVEVVGQFSRFVPVDGGNKYEDEVVADRKYERLNRKCARALDVAFGGYGHMKLNGWGHDHTGNG